jgi:hypothetical protein
MITVKGYSPDLSSSYTLTWHAGVLDHAPIANLVRLYVGEEVYLPPHGPSLTLSLSDPLSILYFLQARTQVRGATGLDTLATSTIRSAVTNFLVQKAERHVRTPAGVARFKQPIDSVIVRDVYTPHPRRNALTGDAGHFTRGTQVTALTPGTDKQVSNVDDWLDKRGITKEALVSRTRALFLSSPDQLARDYPHLSPSEAASIGKRARDYGLPWYFNAHEEAESVAGRYNIPVDLAAAVIAAISPRNRWIVPGELDKNGIDQDLRGRGNIATARTIIRVAQESLHNSDRHITITEEDWKKANKGLDSSAKFLLPSDRHDSVVGTHRIGDLTPAEVAMFHPDLSLPVIPTRLVAAMKLSMSHDVGQPPSTTQSQIDVALGNGAKIRSFYNNIISPGASPDVTIDTHQTRAMMGSIEFPEAAYGEVSKNHDRYAVFADAVRQVAEEEGVHPQQVQAVMWEAWRLIWPDTARRAKTKNLISNARNVTVTRQVPKLGPDGKNLKDPKTKKVIYSTITHSGYDVQRKKVKNKDGSFSMKEVTMIWIKTGDTWYAVDKSRLEKDETDD